MTREKRIWWLIHECAILFQGQFFHKFSSLCGILNWILYKLSANFVGIVQNGSSVFSHFSDLSLHLSPLQRPKHLQKNLATLAIKTFQRHFETLAINNSQRTLKSQINCFLLTSNDPRPNNTGHWWIPIFQSLNCGFIFCEQVLGRRMKLLRSGRIWKWNPDANLCWL